MPRPTTVSQERPSKAQAEWLRCVAAATDKGLAAFPIRRRKVVHEACIRKGWVIEPDFGGVITDAGRQALARCSTAPSAPSVE